MRADRCRRADPAPIVILIVAVAWSTLGWSVWCSGMVDSGRAQAATTGPPISQTDRSQKFAELVRPPTVVQKGMDIRVFTLI